MHFHQPNDYIMNDHINSLKFQLRTYNQGWLCETHEHFGIEESWAEN